MREIGASLASIALAIVGLAILAVLVSKNANTVGVVTAVGQSYANALTAAVAPVSQSGNH